MVSTLPLRNDESQAAEVVARARRGFESGRTKTYEWRIKQLNLLDKLLRERKDEIFEALNKDLGKSQMESWLAELAMVQNELAYARKHLRDWMKPAKVSTPLALQPGRCRIYPQPLGVVLIIGPWNYPLQLVLAPLVGAIAAGNSAVLKPSEMAPATSAVVAKLLPQYLDTECVAVVEGGIPETTALLEQRFDHIFYTGNGRVGRIIMKAAAEHLTPVTLELGGKSPTIVDGSANLEVAARRIAWGKWFNAGQTCVAPDYILAHESIADQLVAKLKTSIREFFGDDPQQATDYGRIINERHFDRLTKLLDNGDVVEGGSHDKSDRYIAPTILRNVSEDSTVMTDEIFGPILPVLTYRTMPEAVRFVNERPKPLAFYVFAEDAGAQRAALDGTTSGGACINDVVAHLSVHGLPFGGVGASGMGAYHGKASFDTFTHMRSTLEKSSRLDVPLRYPPYDDTKQKWLKRLM